MKYKSGDVWPEHYRGSKYHYNSKGDVWWSAPLKILREMVITGHEEIVKKLLEIKPQGGSFRITENGEVITKEVNAGFEDEEEELEVIFVGTITKEFVFTNVNINPLDINPGDVWPAFYEGATYHINAEGIMWWRDRWGVRWFFKHPPTKLAESILMFKRLGGSFKINECGHVIALLEKLPYPEKLQRQINLLNSQVKEIIQQKIENTNLVPIYIGKMDEEIELNKPIDLDKKWDNKETNLLLDKLQNLGTGTRRWPK